MSIFVSALILVLPSGGGDWIERTCRWELSKECVNDTVQLTVRGAGSAESITLELENFYDGTVRDARSLTLATHSSLQAWTCSASHERTSGLGSRTAGFEGARFPFEVLLGFRPRDGWVPSARSDLPSLEPRPGEPWTIDGAAFLDSVLIGGELPLREPDSGCPIMPVGEALLFEDVSGVLRADVTKPAAAGVVGVSISGLLHSGGELPYDCAIIAGVPFVGPVEISPGVSRASYALLVDGSYEWSLRTRRIRLVELEARIVGSEETVGPAQEFARGSRIRSWEGTLKLRMEVGGRRGEGPATPR